LTHSTWIWHSYFGTSSSLNDINILKQLPLFKLVFAGSSWTVNFEINGNTYSNGYYLVDGIYADWRMLIKSKGLVSSNTATKLFTKRQESVQKDIEQTFGILKARFQILTKPALQWYPGNLTSIMNICIILHNMLVEFRSPLKPPPQLPSSICIISPQSEPRSLCNQQIYAVELELCATHNKLTTNLIDHIWDLLCQNNLGSDSDDESFHSSS
jgi:hypothetical protein